MKVLGPCSAAAAVWEVVVCEALEEADEVGVAVVKPGMPVVAGAEALEEADVAVVEPGMVAGAEPLVGVAVEPVPVPVPPVAPYKKLDVSNF
jgi:hypothetical protein